jgi:hypothetical protein
VHLFRKRLKTGRQMSMQGFGQRARMMQGQVSYSIYNVYMRYMRDKITVSIYRKDHKRLTKICKFDESVADMFKRILDYYMVGEHNE